MLEAEAARFLISPERREAIDAKRYYRGEHDILNRSRLAIGADGEPIKLDKLPCTRIVNNQYGRLVDQKINYSLGRSFSLDVPDRDFCGELKQYFGKAGQKLWRQAATEAVNCGVAWLHPYIDECGELKLRLFDSTRCLPLWADAAHTKLDALLRFSPEEYYEGKTRKVRERLFVYSASGIEEYEYRGGRLYGISDQPYHFCDRDGIGYRWDRVPVIAVKYNYESIPMIRRAKSLQDALNELQSDFCDNMAENSRNTVLVLKNFDGEDLGEFRRNLAAYGAVKVRSDAGGDGGVDTLKIEVDAANYETLKTQLSEALVECCRGFDANDSRLGSNPNQMNILAIYSDIDLDANGFEMELGGAFDEWIGYIRSYLYHTGRGDYRMAEAEVVFNRDLLINETSVISSINASSGILSPRTLVASHPLVSDVDRELERLGIAE